MTEAAITWRKFVLSDDEKGDQIVELSWDGARVFELAYRRGEQPRASIRTYASPALAQRSHDKRVATLLRKDHYEDGTRQGPPPLVDDAEVARAEREEDRRLAREQFDEGLPRFVDAWQALGFDPRADFATQGARSATSPVVIAERCLEVARSAFGIGFYRLQQGPEGEHGQGRPTVVKPIQTAAFYVSPARVVAIVRLHLQGRMSGHDGVGPDVKGGGWDHYGVEDEVRAAIATLVARETGVQSSS